MHKYMIAEFADMKKFLNSIHVHRRQNVFFRQKTGEFLLNSNSY